MLALAFHDCTKDAASANGAFFDFLIRLRTGSPLVHVEMAFDVSDLTSAPCFSAVPGQGVRIARLDLTRPEWTLLTLPGLDPRIARGAALPMLGEAYDWLGIVGGFTWPEPVGWHDDKDKFCSEAVLTVLQEGFGLYTEYAPWKVSPAKLYVIASNPEKAVAARGLDMTQ